MQLTSEAIVRTAVVLTIEGVVYGLAVRRDLFRRLPIFTSYLLAVVLCDVARFALILTLGQASRQEFVTYWGTQAVLVVLRGGVIYELCRLLLSQYPGVWRLCWITLLLAGLVLLLAAMTVDIDHGPYIARVILNLDRGIEMGILGVLVTAMWFCRYYRIPIPRLIGLVGLGLSLYSAINVVSNTMADQWFQSFQRIWTEIRGDSFILAEATWLAAIWKPLPQIQPSPDLLDYQVYSHMASDVNVRLRELNSWLEEVLK